MNDRDAIIWAAGGGAGHLQRALAVARDFASATIFHSSPVWVELPATVRVAEASPGALESLDDPSQFVLVVDTFPAGLVGEIDDSVLRRFAASVLVARWLDRERYMAVADYDDAHRSYDEVWLPYDPDECEWEGEMSGRYVGFKTRTVALADAECEAVVVGELPPGYSIPTDAPEVVHVTGRFDRLPRAQRYIGTGAGYNLSYELLRLADRRRVRCIPHERRYDNQFRRVLRHGIGVSTPAQFADFVRSGA